MIKSAGWEDLGFARVFDAARQAPVPASTLPNEDHASAVALASYYEKRAGYKILSDSQAVWMRDPGKVKGTIKAPFTVLGDLNASNHQNSDLYKQVALIRATDYGTVEVSSLASGALQSRIREFEAAPKTASGFYSLSVAVAFHQQDGFDSYLRECLAPAFFKAFPKGRVRLVRAWYDFDRRQGCVRGGYVAAQYGLSSIANERSLQAMSRWTVLAPGDQLRLVLDLGALALYPNVPYIPAYRPGLAVIFVPGEAIRQDPSPFPSDWLSIYGSRADFANRSGGANQAKGERRYSNPAPLKTAVILDWVNWLIERCGDHIRWSTDPTGYLKDGLVDFVTCMEHGLTIDRLFRKGIAAQTAAQMSLRKGAAFEVADILQELADYWSGKQSDLFKKIFRPDLGKALLGQAFASVPAPVHAMLTTGADAAYTALAASVRASVIRPDKTTTAGVMVRDRALTAEALEDFDTFTGNVVRALRNTHHGYMTAQDRQARPSRYLALVSGETPDELPYIGVLAALAYLANPEVMVQRPSYPLGQYD